MDEKLMTLPVIALRGLTVLPEMIQHFDCLLYTSDAADD